VTSSPVPGVRVEPSVLRAATLVQLLTQVPDPRKRRGRRHPLVVVLVIAVGAVTAGARSLTSIGEWAHDVGADLLEQVHLEAAVPSEATIRRVIEALDAGVFAQLCGAWTRLRWRQVDGQGVIAVDGKTVRRAPLAEAGHRIWSRRSPTTPVWCSGRSPSTPSPTRSPPCAIC